MQPLSSSTPVRPGILSDLAFQAPVNQTSAEDSQKKQIEKQKKLLQIYQNEMPYYPAEQPAESTEPEELHEVYLTQLKLLLCEYKQIGKGILPEERQREIDLQIEALITEKFYSMENLRAFFPAQKNKFFCYYKKNLEEIFLQFCDLKNTGKFHATATENYINLIDKLGFCISGIDNFFAEISHQLFASDASENSVLTELCNTIINELAAKFIIENNISSAFETHILHLFYDFAREAHIDIARSDLFQGNDPYRDKLGIDLIQAQEWFLNNFYKRYSVINIVEALINYFRVELKKIDFNVPEDLAKDADALVQFSKVVTEKIKKILSPFLNLGIITIDMALNIDCDDSGHYKTTLNEDFLKNLPSYCLQLIYKSGLVKVDINTAIFQPLFEQIVPVLFGDEKQNGRFAELEQTGSFTYPDDENFLRNFIVILQQKKINQFLMRISPLQDQNFKDAMSAYAIESSGEKISKEESLKVIELLKTISDRLFANKETEMLIYCTYLILTTYLSLWQSADTKEEKQELSSIIYDTTVKCVDLLIISSSDILRFFKNLNDIIWGIFFGEATHTKEVNKLLDTLMQLYFEKKCWRNAVSLSHLLISKQRLERNMLKDVNSYLIACLNCVSLSYDEVKILSLLSRDLFLQIPKLGCDKSVEDIALIHRNYDLFSQLIDKEYLDGNYKNVKILCQKMYQLNPNSLPVEKYLYSCCSFLEKEDLNFIIKKLGNGYFQQMLNEVQDPAVDEKNQQNKRNLNLLLHIAKNAYYKKYYQGFKVLCGKIFSMDQNDIEANQIILAEKLLFACSSQVSGEEDFAGCLQIPNRFFDFRIHNAIMITDAEMNECKKRNYSVLLAMADKAFKAEDYQNAKLLYKKLHTLRRNNIQFCERFLLSYKKNPSKDDFFILQNLFNDLVGRNVSKSRNKRLFYFIEIAENRAVYDVDFQLEASLLTTITERIESHKQIDDQVWKCVVAFVKNVPAFVSKDVLNLLSRMQKSLETDSQIEGTNIAQRKSTLAEMIQKMQPSPDAATPSRSENTMPKVKIMVRIPAKSLFFKRSAAAEEQESVLGKRQPDRNASEQKQQEPLAKKRRVEDRDDPMTDSSDSKQNGSLNP